MFERIGLGRYRISIIATYNGARPVVIDTQDHEVVANVLGDLPMRYAFRSGQTRLFDGLAEAAAVAKAWPLRSTLLVLVSDGDTVPATGMPAMPPSIHDVLVVGVGDWRKGSFIDGRQSRQDVSALRQIAARLRGVFHNANESQIPTDTLRAISREGERSPLERFTKREYALAAVAVAACWLALLPLLLSRAGTAWRPGVPLGRASGDEKRARDAALDDRIPGSSSQPVPAGAARATTAIGRTR
jgi:Ca-activated chloride channel family protein